MSCFLGLRKLEAFFGFLITVMAVSFGYEASFGLKCYALFFKIEILINISDICGVERFLTAR